MTAGRWHRRMMRLERLMPIPEPTCPGCNYPDAILCASVLTVGDEPIPKCLVCGRNVSQDGTPLAASVSHIILPPIGSEYLCR